MTPSPAPSGFSHVATITPDLDRFRSFYEDVVGLRCVAVMQMKHPPHLRHAALAAGRGGVLHPDGLVAELNCPNPAFDHEREPGDSFIEIAAADLIRSIVGAPA